MPLVIRFGRALKKARERKLGHCPQSSTLKRGRRGD
jgi:hypothetical protein